MHVVVGIMGSLSREMGLAGKEGSCGHFGAYVIVRSCILKIIAWYDLLMFRGAGMEVIAGGMGSRLKRDMKATSGVLESFSL